MNRWFTLVLAALVCCRIFLTPFPVFAEDAASSTSQAQDEENRNFFTHEGEELRFYSDLLKDRTVVINFFYVDCPTAQPGLISFFRLQKILGEKLGKDVLLLTISVDPEKDTVEAVREYARKYNPQKGWFFITGKKADMDVINRKLGNTLKLPEGHLRMFLLGNLRTGNWMRMIDSAPVVALKEGIRSLEGKEKGE
jgi:cytochrome oxidase Cu insertion factor (SCO1/SenC/PrrC family)